MRKTGILWLAACLLLTCCTKEGNTIYKPTPGEEQPATTPLVTVIYGPNGLGDRSYNDLIYKGVEMAAKQYGLRTLQLAPESEEQGLVYLETMFRQMESASDTVRRLFITPSPVYDDFIRKNNKRLEANPYADLLYLETSTPLEGKGSTFYIDYYGAMYMGGCMAQYCSNFLLSLILANRDDLLAVIGPFDSDNVELLAPYCQQTKKPLILPTASSETVIRRFAITSTGNGQKPFLWSLTETDVSLSEVMMSLYANFLAIRGGTALNSEQHSGLFAPASTYGQTFVEWAPFQAAEFGIGFATCEQYTSTDDLLKETLQSMADACQFRQMLVCLEPCYSANMGKALEGIPGVLAICSAGPYEQSFADSWSNELGVWMCDRFSRNLIGHATEYPNGTYRDLYLYCAQHTLGSHVGIYNYTYFGNLYTTSPKDFFVKNI